jgi:integrase
MDLALRDGRIGRNPAVGVRLPRAVRGEPRFLSPPELTALVRASGPGGLAICVLAFTGIRFGELTALRVVRVDLVRRRLHIAESASEIGGRLVWSTTKNHQTRSVPVPPGLTPMLEEAVAGKEPGDLVFMSPHGGPLRLGNWRTRVFDPACAAAGIVGLTPHDLRHTAAAASLAIAAGANVKAVQRMLGHSSAAMTLDVYAGLFGDDLDSVAALLDAHVPQMRHSGEITAVAGRPK